MPVPTANPSPNPYFSPEDIGETLGSAVSASFSETLRDNPVTSVYRTARMKAVAGRTGGITGIDPGRTSAGWEFAGIDEYEYQASSDPNWVTREEAAEIAAPYGETVDSLGISPIGANAIALRIILQARNEQRERQRIIASGGTGVIGTVATMGASVAASFLDPVNIAASFVPVVSQAKYLNALSRATTVGSRLLVRTRVGLAEGAVGAALVEPLTLVAAKSEHLDYTAYDAVMNVVYGSVFGASLHSGSGLISDTFNRVPFRNRQTATQHAVVAGIEDKKLHASTAVELTDRVRVSDEVTGFVGKKVGSVDAWPSPIRISDEVSFAEMLNETPTDILTPNMQRAIEDAASAADPEAASRQLLERWSEFNDRNVRDLRAIYGKDAPVPMSHYIQELGGLSPEAQERLAKALPDIDIEQLRKRRPQLFRNEGGISLDDAKRAVIDKQYVQTQKIGDKGIAGLIKREIFGDRVWRPDDAKKVQRMNAIGEAIKAQLDDSRVRISLDEDAAQQWDAVYNSPENAFLFDEQAERRATELLDGPELLPENLADDLKDVDQLISAAEERGIGLDDYHSTIRQIDEDATRTAKAYQVAADCVIGGV